MKPLKTKSLYFLSERNMKANTTTTTTTVAPAFNSLFFNPRFSFSSPPSSSFPITNLTPHPVYRVRITGTRTILCPSRASISERGQGTYDPELRSVLQLATGSELYELERILFGPSYFSPLFKSIVKPADVDYFMIEEDPEERDDFIAILESRFFFLTADARSTLRGWRPSYRDVLLGVRKKLSIPCSTKLSAEDLEVEIFLHLLHDYSSEDLGNFVASWERSKTSDSQSSLELGLSQWKVQAVAALKAGAVDLRSMILKGGGMLTVGKIYQLLARGLSGKIFMEAANHRLKNEAIRKAGHLAAANLESRAAMLAAKQGIAGAAARYLGLRSMMQLLGPVLWGTLLADVVIQMLGTDYARILRAIYAFAQIRIARTYR